MNWLEPKSRIHDQRGFTLVEVLVVMVIIGIIASMLLVNFQDARGRARDANRKADLRQVKSALQLYYNDFNVFPASNSGRVQGCGADGDTNCDWGDTFEARVVYMNQLPIDPLNNSNHFYSYERINVDEYQLTVRLENLSDQDIENSQERCDYTGTDDALFVMCQD